MINACSTTLAMRCDAELIVGFVTAEKHIESSNEDEPAEIITIEAEHVMNFFVHCIVDDRLTLKPNPDRVDALVWTDLDDVVYVATSEPPPKRKLTDLKPSLLGWEVKHNAMPDVFSGDGAEIGVDMSSCLYSADALRGLYPNPKEQGIYEPHQWALQQWIERQQEVAPAAFDPNGLQ